MKVGFIPNLGVIVRDKNCKKLDVNEDYHVFSESFGRYVDVTYSLIEWDEEINEILKISKAIETIHMSKTAIVWAMEMKLWHDNKLKKIIPNYLEFKKKKENLKKEYKMMNSAK